MFSKTEHKKLVEKYSVLFIVLPRVLQFSFVQTFERNSLISDSP